MNTKKLAEIIGVSRATLSKVLNGKEGVAPETEKLIKEYIKKYNFAPNNAARNLIGKKNNIIGLFFKDSSVDHNDSGTSSHFSTEYTNFAINEAKKKNYKVLVSIINNKSEYSEILKCFNSGIISGAVLLGYDNNDFEMKKILKNENKVIIINQEELPPSEYVKIINIDDVSASSNAMKILLENGRKNILYIGAEQKRLPSIRRERGAKAYYEINKENFEKMRIENGDFTKESGYSIMKKVLAEADDYPTGVFAANDFMALGAIEAIIESGLKVPEDISVIGFDDIEIAKYCTPSLSTMKSSFQEAASKSINTLIDFIEGKEVPDIQEWEVNFIQRESLSGGKK